VPELRQITGVDHVPRPDGQLPIGDLIGVTFTAFRVRREGWTLVVRRNWEWAPAGAPDEERYSALARGELLDVLDALRDQLGVGSEYGG
jgi:hypothetical protein